MKRDNRGITLIALVITIIVLLILTGVSITTLTGDNGLITRANESKFKLEISAIQEELQLFKTSKIAEDTGFIEDTLNASKTTLTYNTKPEGETGNIGTIFPRLNESDKEKVEIIKGKIVYHTKEVSEIKWLQELGIEPNPYEIVDGELTSSDGNLLLMDSTGTVRIPETVTKIGSGAFRDLTGLKTIVIPGTCKEIGDYAFSNNTTLENVIIEDGVEKIGSFAFEGCISIKEINLPDSITTVGKTCFRNCASLEKIKLSKNLNTIQYRLLASCTNLKNIEIPEGVIRIQSHAFEYCTSLTNIKIPDSITTIDSGAFSNMYQLENVEISANNDKYRFQNGLLLSKDGTILYQGLSNLTTLNLPDTVTTIETNSLTSCGKLININIPKSVTTINSEIPSNIKRIDVEEGNLYFKSINGNLYDINVETLIKYCSNESEVTLPDTVKKIKQAAISGQNNITKLNLPDSLESIEGFAFDGMKITSLEIPQNVKEIYPTAFANMNIDISIVEENKTYKSVDNIYVLSKDGKELRIVTKDIKEYNIPDTVEIIGGYTFYSKYNFNNIILPDNIKEIESSAFDYAINLQRIEIQSNIEKIGATAFSRCNSLSEIIIHKPKGDIENSPFGCPLGERAVKWDK